MIVSLLGLAMLLLVLFVAGRLLGRIGQSVIPAYILLGVATRGTLADPRVIHFISVIGISLLLFFVGLEFSVLRLRRGGQHLVRAGALDFVANFPVGFVAGLVLGWNLPAAFLLGTALYVSSSAIVAHNISSLHRAAFMETETALAVIIAEDLIVALLLAGVALWLPLGGAGTPLATGLGIVTLLLLLTVLAGPVTRLIDRLGEGSDDDVLLLGILGLLMLFAGGALWAGLSEAVGAFVAGLLVGDSRLKGRVEALLAPFRGLFSALFFFAFGLGVEAASLAPVWLSGLILAVAALVSKLGGSLWIGAAGGLPLVSRINLGFTLAPRGEFSVLLAAYGASTGHPELSALIAVVVVALSVGGTLLTQAGPVLSTGLARRLEALKKNRRPGPGDERPI